MKKLLSLSLIIFSLLFLYYPTSYALTDFKIIISFVVICVIIKYVLKKFNIEIKIPEKNYVLIILILSVLTRVGIVLLFNNKITQISDFSLALESAKSGAFQDVYYQVFSHWLLYPVILGKIFKIFGASQMIALLFNSFILILTALVIYKLSMLIFSDKKSGFYASLLYIFWPSNILYNNIVTPEHICSLLLVVILYLFLLLIKNNFYKDKKYKYLITSFFIGILLSISSFFKNFSYVFLIAFTIFFILNFIQNFKRNNNLKSFFLNNKLISMVIIVFIFFISNCFIFNIIEKNYVKAPVVRNVAPCYLNVGWRDNGVYNKENYQMYFDLLEQNNYDYKKTNKEILADLKNYLITVKGITGVKELLDSKAKIIYGNDESKIDFTVYSLNNTEGGLSNFLNTSFKDINNKYFIILVFLGILGLIHLVKEKNLKLFLSYLIFYGSLLLILVVEGQNRYMYSVQTLMCINAVAGIKILQNFLNKYINPQKIINSELNYKSIFYAGLFLLIFIFLNIFVPSFMFIFKASISKIYCYISLLLSIVVVYWLMKKNKILNIKTLIVSIFIPIIIILVSINVSGKFFDSTWDGNMYHKAAIGYLMDGWNPLEEDIQSFDAKQESPKDLLEWSHLWIDHYPKASYVFGASIGVITNNVESGKSINILSIFVLFCFSVSLLLYKKRNVIFSIIFSLVVVTCTTIGSQIFTNFIDGLVYLYIFMIMYFFIANEQKDYVNKNVLYCTYFMILIILINIKFSSFGYAGLLCLGYYIWYIIRLIRKKYDMKEFLKFTGISALAVILAVFVVGVSVYPKNLIDHGHPFYPLMGKGSKEIMLQETLYSLEHASPIKRFLVSTFSEAMNLSRASMVEATLKIPFSIHQNELEFAQTYDLRISGNGLLFSGILVICLLLLIPLMIKEYKNDKKNFILYFIPLLISLAMVFIMEDLWWARYFPQIHFVVFIVLLLFDKYKSESYILKFLIIVVLLNNFMFLIGNIDRTVAGTINANNQLADFKSYWTPEDCKMKVYSLIFPGGYFNFEDELKDYEITYTSHPLDRDYQYVLNNGYAAGICEEK